MTRTDDRLISLADFLRFMRRIRGMTQAEMAEFAGVSRSYVSRVENRRISPSLKFLAAAQVAYGVVFKVTVGGKEPVYLDDVEPR